jgi:hypothetical protein
VNRVAKKRFSGGLIRGWEIGGYEETTEKEEESD